MSIALLLALVIIGYPMLAFGFTIAQAIRPVGPLAPVPVRICRSKRQAKLYRRFLRRQS